MEQKSFPAIGGLILGVSIIISTIIGAYAFYMVRSFDNTLSVTGSTKRHVTADSVKWTAVFTRNIFVNDLKNGYTAMDNDLKLVKAFYKDNGVEESSITISPVFMNEVYNYKSDQTPSAREYSLRQTVELQSGDVQKVTELAKKSSNLINKGVIFSTQGLEYYYSRLADLRVELLSDAIKDAKARAAKLAESSGKQVGTLKSASSGVVQVLPLNSVEISDYGAYDTSSIEKEVMVSVRAAFTLK